MKPPPSREPADRERFLAAVAERVPVERVVELYLFQPIRQGGVESGVAVIAAHTDLAAGAASEPHQRVGGPADRSSSAAAAPDARADDVAATASPEGTTSPTEPSEVAEPRAAPPASDAPEPRFTVFTARYRHVLKGPERGRWEVSVVAEADAPLDTVGAVVRGVQRRAGDVEPPEHMTGDALREVLGQQPA